MSDLPLRLALCAISLWVLLFVLACWWRAGRKGRA